MKALDAFLLRMVVDQCLNRPGFIA